MWLDLDLLIWCVCVCVYVCVCVCVCLSRVSFWNTCGVSAVYLQWLLRGFEDLWMRPWVNACVYRCISVHTYMHVYMWVQVYIWYTGICMCIRVYKCVYRATSFVIIQEGNNHFPSSPEGIAVLWQWRHYSLPFLRNKLTVKKCTVWCWPAVTTSTTTSTKITVVYAYQGFPFSTFQNGKHYNSTVTINISNLYK